MAAGLRKLRVRRVNVQKKKFQTARATDTTMSRTDWMTVRTGAGIRGIELTVSSTEPTVSPKSSRAFLLTTSVRSGALSCTATGLLASRGRQRIVNELMSFCDRLEQQSLSSLDAHQQLVETLLATLTDSHSAEELAENWARVSQHFDTLFTTEASIDALKQTILQLAVMGKLVPQDPNDEPASELLKRIEQEKAQLVKEGKIKKQKTLPSVSDDEKPFELPQGWEWCRLPDLGELARGKSKHRPRNDPALYVDGNFPLVQTGDVSRSNGSIKTFTALYNELGVKQSRIWPKGTLCITIAANIADSGMLEFDACFPDSVVGYSPYITDIPVKYFDFFMRTMKSSLEKYAPSTAQKNINLDILSQVFVPCPPLSEFGRIVCKVEILFSLLDTLKSRLQSAQQTQLHLADALTDAALN